MFNGLKHFFLKELPGTLLNKSMDAYGFAKQHPKEAALSATSVWILYLMIQAPSNITCIDLYLLVVMNTPTLAVVEWDEQRGMDTALKT